MRIWGGREVTHSLQEASEQGLNQRTECLAALQAQSRSHIGTETPVRLGDKSRGHRRVRLYQMWGMALTEPAKGQRGWHGRAS